MYPVSQEYVAKLHSGAFEPDDEVISGVIALSDGRTVAVDGGMIEAGSLYVSSELFDGDTFGLGSARFYELGMTIVGFDDPYDLADARVRLVYSLKTSAGYEAVPLWEFIVDGGSIERVRERVTFKAYNLMKLFDSYINEATEDEEPADLEDEQAYDLLLFCCERAGIMLKNTREEIAAMPNGVRSYTVSDTVETLRDLVSWLCSALGAFARITRDGRLEIVQITATLQGGKPLPDRIIPANVRSGTTFSDVEMRINAVNSYFYGTRRGWITKTEGARIFRLVLPENPLVNIAERQGQFDFVHELYDSLSRVRYQACQTSYIGDISLDCGDYLQLSGGEIDNAAGSIVALLSSQTWRFRGEHSLTSVGGLGSTAAGVASQISKVVNNSGLGAGGGSAGNMVYYDILGKNITLSGTAKDILSIGFGAVSSSVPLFGATLQLDLTSPGAVDFLLIYDSRELQVFTHNFSVVGLNVFAIAGFPLLGSGNGGHEIKLQARFSEGSGAAGQLVTEGCYATVNGTGLTGETPWNGTLHFVEQFEGLTIGFEGVSFKNFTEALELHIPPPINRTLQEHFSGLETGFQGIAFKDFSGEFSPEREDIPHHTFGEVFEGLTIGFEGISFKGFDEEINID